MKKTLSTVWLCFFSLSLILGNVSLARAADKKPAAPSAKKSEAVLEKSAQDAAPSQPAAPNSLQQIAVNAAKLLLKVAAQKTADTATSNQNTQPQAPKAQTLSALTDPPPPPTVPSAPQNPLTFLKGFNGNYETDLFTGAATYSLPLWIPEGRLNAKPAVSFSYSSNNHKPDSIVGYAWNLSMSSIYRSTPKGINQLYNQNNFSMELFGSAKELISTDAANGKYASKVEGSFEDYTFQNNAWIMTDTKGTQYFFGSSSGSRQTDPNDATHTYKWLLEKIQDTNGNTVNFTYFSDAGQIYPATIRYSGHDSDPGLYEIQFARTAHLYPLTSYVTGFKVQTNYLIDHIDILAHTDPTPPLVRRYQLTYDYGQNSLPKLAQIVTQNGANQLPPLKFFYFDGTQATPGKIGLLREIQYPAGGIQDIAYQQSTAYRTQAQGPATTDLPFQIDTVHTSILKTSANDPAATYTYDYAGGHYYFDSLDAYKKEYAGFRQVTIKDPLNNTRTLFFHQSEFSKDNAQSVLQGEYADHISKKGRIYRQEVRDAGGNLFQTVLRKWDKRSEPDDDASAERWFPFLARETTITYDGNATARATAVEKTYDDYGNMTQSTDYGEVQTSDDAGNFTDIGTDKLTTTIQYAQNAGAHIFAFPQLEQLTDNNNALIGENKKYYDTLALGQVNKGNLTKVEKRINNQPTYQTAQTVYNTYGLPTTFTNPRQYQTTIAYETYNLFPQTITNAKNQATNYTYNYLYGLVNQATDPNGAKTIAALDTLGRLSETRKTDPNNPTQDLALTNITYNTATYPNSVTTILHTQNQNIDAESVTYVDGFVRPVQSKTETEGANQYVVTSKTYDLLGNVQKEYLPKTTTGNSYETIVTGDPGTSYAYDVMGRALTAANTLGTTTNTYDDWSTSVTDPDSKRKDYVADARGNLVQVKEYIGSTPYTTAYTYDGLQNLTNITDAKGNVRNFTYDLLGRKLSQEDLHTSNDATFGSWTYGYDANNNLTTQTDPKNQTINYTYDELDRPLTENYTGQSGTEVTETYDQGTNGIGKLTSVSTSDIQKSYSYDILGRPTQEQKTIGSQTYTTNFTYNLPGNPLSVDYPGGMTVSYGYNNAAQLATVTKNGATAVVTNLDFAPTGSPTQIDYGNGVTTQNTYDPQKIYRLTRKLTAKGANKLQDTSYQFDPVGNITSLIDASDTNTAKTASYGYDDLHRLTSATITNTANNQNYTQTYSYDILGNILTRSDVGTYAYAGGDSGTSNNTTANPDAATTVNGTDYTYDPNGNATSDGVWTYAYDYKDRITSATNGIDTYNYFYDESGTRIKKENAGTGKITLYINKYEDIEDGNAKRYIYANDLKVADDSDADGLTYHHTDHLTGANVDTDATGNILEVLDYYPYGNVRLDEPTASYQNDYKYTGKELDEGTNLYYYGARYYNAQIGRFMSQDPWGGDMKDPQSLNKYAYARNNPMRYTDPTGKEYEKEKSMADYFLAPFVQFGRGLAGMESTAESGPEQGAYSLGAGMYMGMGAAEAVGGAAAVGAGAAMQIQGVAACATGAGCVEGAASAVVGASAAAAGVGFMQDGVGKMQNSVKNVLNASGQNSGSQNDTDPITQKWVPAGKEATQSPGEGWEWRGEGDVGSPEGSWYNPKTDESLRPDFNHGPPEGPHWDYQKPEGKGHEYRVSPGGGYPVPKVT